VIEPAAWDAAVGALKEARSATVVGHVYPDGDALGSVLALSLALRRLGLEVTASFSEPYELPAALAILPGHEVLVEPSQVSTAPELLIAVDTASVARLGTLADRADTAGTLLVIDHHASNTGFGALRLIDPDAPAAGMVVAGLIDRLGIAYDAPIASCLYAAISSDTGSFRFGSTTAEVHRLAARLLDTGIPHDAIARALFDTHPAGWLAMLAAALGRVALDEAALGGAGLVWTSVGIADLAGNGLSFGHAETVVDVLRTVEDADVAVVFKEREPGLWIVSTRSRGAVDVGAVCVALGGGGHRLAAGYTAYGPLDDAVRTLRLALEQDGAPRVSA
jgi:phosphoesterase RecJ-like protein